VRGEGGGDDEGQGEGADHGVDWVDGGRDKRCPGIASGFLWGRTGERRALPLMVREVVLSPGR
jgi:hypothetical protein